MVGCGVGVLCYGVWPEMKMYERSVSGFLGHWGCRWICMGCREGGSFDVGLCSGYDLKAGSSLNGLGINGDWGFEDSVQVVLVTKVVWFDNVWKLTMQMTMCIFLYENEMQMN